MRRGVVILVALAAFLLGMSVATADSTESDGFSWGRHTEVEVYTPDEQARHRDPSTWEQGPRPLVFAGVDRYATAAQVADKRGLRGTRTLFIANGETMVDAMVVGLGTHPEDNILLVKQDEVPPATKWALARSSHAYLVFLGGDTAISPEVREEVILLSCNYVAAGSEGCWESAIVE